MANHGTGTPQQPSAMVGGDGPQSYFQNSHYQRASADAAKRMISEGIKEKLDFKNPCFETLSTFRVADFGCSVGPNTFFAVENIIEAVKDKHQTQLQNASPLEFQVFFNDVTSNDFNTLFRNLPKDPNYTAAGVPGSFYGRLFPESTVHFAHASYAVHWLSVIPKEIVDSKSPAWNKDSVYCRGSNEEVVKAYSSQFRHDMDNFLNARAQEIVGGGLMAIVIVGVPDGVLSFETGSGMFYDLFGSCLIDMAKLGVFTEEQVESFNLPMHFSHVTEVEAIINENGHFNIEKIDTFSSLINSLKLSVESLVSASRAVFGELVKRHFGNDAGVDQMYKYFERKLSKKISMSEGTKQHINIVILLKRHSN